MKIQKLGHCCLVVEIDGVRILTDPGMLSTAQGEAKNIDLILITHEHADHLHIESVKKLLENNPGVSVIANASVGKILEADGIKYEKIEHGEKGAHKNITIEGVGEKHAEIYKEFGQVQNTGFFIGGRLFCPGDALTIPGERPEVLALPVAGPWIKIREAVEYGLAVKPKYAFPIHDGVVSWTAPFHAIPQKFLGEAEIEFTPMLVGDEHNF